MRNAKLNYRKCQRLYVGAHPRVRPDILSYLYRIYVDGIEIIT